jgi:hypothetical protein
MRQAPGALVGVVGVALSATLFGAAASRAHLGGAEGVMPFVDDGALVGAGTTWGLVAGGVDGAFSQTCEESIGDVPRAFVRSASSDGVPRTLAATALGVMATVDGGCTWTPVPGTEGRSMTALVSSPTSPATLWATTATVDADNDVLVSHDGGATFAVFQAVPAGVLLTSLAVGVVVGGDDDGLDRLLVAGVDTVARVPLLLVGTSSGLVPVPVGPLDGAQLVRALTVDDDALWFSTLDQIGRGHLFRMPVTTAGADDGAAVEVGSFDGLVKAAASVAGFRFVIAAGGLLFRARATDLEAPVVEQSVWTRTVDGPLQCLQRVAGDARLWGCATPTAGTWFKATVDGETWQDMLAVDDVAEHACPSETPGAALCAYQVTELPADDEPADPTPPPAPSCGQTAGDAHGLFVVVGAVLLGRLGPGRWRRRHQP